MRHSRYWSRVVVLVLGVTGLAGCQAPEHRASPSILEASGAPERTKLSAQQKADVQVAYGRSLEKSGLLQPAMTAYEDALKQNPQRVDALVRLAVLSDQEGKFAKSLALYQKALALRPGDPDLFCNMGYSLYLQQRWKDAGMNYQ